MDEKIFWGEIGQNWGRCKKQLFDGVPRVFPIFENRVYAQDPNFGFHFPNFGFQAFFHFSNFGLKPKFWFETRNLI